MLLCHEDTSHPRPCVYLLYNNYHHCHIVTLHCEQHAARLQNVHWSHTMQKQSYDMMDSLVLLPRSIVRAL